MSKNHKRAVFFPFSLERSSESDPEERISTDENLVATNSPAHKLASLEFPSEVGEQSLCHLSVADEGIQYIDQVFSLSSGDDECNLSSPQEDADSSFLEFVKTEGLVLHAQAKKNIVGVVMMEYSSKLSEIESRLAMLGQLISEEEMALRQKEEREQALEEELVLLKKEMLEKQRYIKDLRGQCTCLHVKKLYLKRKVVYCQEVEQQLESGNGCSLKKVRSE